MPLKYFKDQSGIGLLEMVVALGIATAVIVSLVSLSLFTVRSSLRNTLFLEGSKMANREVELVRGLRDVSDVWSNGTDGFLDILDGCIVEVVGGTDAACSMDPSNLQNVSTQPTTEGTGARAVTRYFYITYPEPGNTDLVRVNVVVSWKIGSEDQFAYNYADLTNWRGK